MTTATVTHLVWDAKGWMVRTPPLNHILEQGLLAIVGGEHGDLVCRVAKQAHVLVQRDHVLGLCQVLEEVRYRHSLPSALKVWCVCTYAQTDMTAGATVGARGADGHCGG